MTMPYERTRAVLQTRDFLRQLMTDVESARLPVAVREEARRLLRHYAGSSDMFLAHVALPQWFGEVDPADRCR